MAHCVYHAFNHHLAHLDEPSFWQVWDTYLYCKQFTHHSTHEYTFAGVIPWLYTRMLQVHNQLSLNKISMVIQIHYVPWGSLLAEAGESGNKRMVMESAPYKGQHVDKVTVAPAIYCMLNQQHALFATEVPDWPGARIIMAIALNKYAQEKSNGRHPI